MDLINELEKYSFSGITEYIRDRFVIIGNGTGNLLNVGSRNFIITCKHIAEQFFNSDRLYVVLRDNVRIPTENLKLLNVTDDSLDIALIEIQGEFQSRGTYTLNDLEIIEDFCIHDWSLTDLIVCGFPGDLIDRDKSGNFYQSYLSFITVPHKSKKCNENFIFGEYPMNKDMIENQSKSKVRLPSAKGLSGSFILKIKQFEGEKDDLWFPSLAKVIAVQQEWDEMTYIKGTNIKHVLTLLKKVGAL